MTKEFFSRLQAYMCACMDDSAHDREHVYRVLYNALEIARNEPDVDWDVLIAACLLHDVGRREQFADPGCCHAVVGGEKAFRFLTEQGMDAAFAGQVRHCIQTHRFRSDLQPETPEAKILFDADKLDATGALGIARTLMYKGDQTEPLYTLLPDGTVSDGVQDRRPSFFREYHFKLERLYDRFYTEKGRELAESRRIAAELFYQRLYGEISANRAAGEDLLHSLLEVEP